MKRWFNVPKVCFDVCTKSGEQLILAHKARHGPAKRIQLTVESSIFRKKKTNTNCEPRVREWVGQVDSYENDANKWNTWITIEMINRQANITRERWRSSECIASVIRKAVKSGTKWTADWSQWTQRYLNSQIHDLQMQKRKLLWPMNDSKLICDSLAGRVNDGRPIDQYQKLKVQFKEKKHFFFCALCSATARSATNTFAKQSHRSFFDSVKEISLFDFIAFYWMSTLRCRRWFVVICCYSIIIHHYCLKLGLGVRRMQCLVLPIIS